MRGQDTHERERNRRHNYERHPEGLKPSYDDDVDQDQNHSKGKT